MRAYVKVIYSSEGASPGEVERAFMDCGFQKVRGSSIFDTEIDSESDLADKLNKLHDALRGLKVEYTPSIQVPEEFPRSEVPGYRERLEGWRVLGVDVGELSAVLERDPEEFRQRGREIMSAQIDRIADEKMREAQEQETKRHLEGARDEILRQVGSGSKTFHDLVRAVDIDADIVSGILDELVEKGRIRAEQQGRKVVFVPA